MALQQFNMDVGVVQQVNFAPARALLSLVTWFVVMQTRCFGAILSWIVYSVVFVGAHAAFRVPPSEYRTTKRPGVHFREVVGTCPYIPSWNFQPPLWKGILTFSSRCHLVSVLRVLVA